MNSDYILKGKGQITLHQPDWAKFTPGNPVTSASQSSDEPAQATSRAKPRMNEFTHSGSKKTVGPDVDNVDYTFDDFLDTINPLQQIPILNMVYRNLTGDRISGVAQVTGSALYGGPIGIITGAIDAIFEQEKGGDMGETILAGLFGTDTPNAKNLPSNQPGNQPHQLPDAVPGDLPAGYGSGSMLANAAPTAQKIAVKQPFGGVMGDQTPPAGADPLQTVEHITQDESDQETPILAGAKDTMPATHRPFEAEGRKMYSLAGVTRHPSVATVMPPHNVPDARLKSYGKMTASSTPPSLDAAATILGLQQKGAALAATDEGASLPNPGFSAPLPVGDIKTPSGNAIPAALIQDMMLMNMQKYQDGLKNGIMPSRGASLDVNG